MGSLIFCCKTCNCPRETDTAPGRRRILTDLVTKQSSDVKVTAEYIEKPDGTLLFGKLFEPINASDAIGMICFCIGFGDHISFLCHDIGIAYAEMGFVLFMCDWKGHGKSDGQFMHISHFDTDIVDEGIWAFDYVIQKYIKPHKIYSETIDKAKNYFLSGSSMGGAIAIKIALKSAAQKWKGLVIACPMVSIVEDAKPPKCVIYCLKNCCLPCCPRAKLIPNEVRPENLSNDEAVRLSIEENPLFYDQWVSLITGYNVLRVTEVIEAEKERVNLPLFIGHGNEDRVTECQMSQDFYHKCGTEIEQKSIKIYDGHGHALYEEDTGIVHDSVAWMRQRIAV